jgi:integrase
MGRKKGASRRRRITKDGSVRYDIRWREFIDGKMRELSHTASSPAEADAFQRRCLAKKGVVGNMESMMDEDMRKPGECLVLLEEMVAKAKARSIKRSFYPTTIRNILRAIFTHFEWRWTSDIPSDALDLIREYYGREKLPSGYNGCQMLKAFIRWCYEKYIVRESILLKPTVGYKKKSYYIWTDEEKDMIMQTITAQHAPCDRIATAKHCNEWRQRKAEASHAKTRQSLFAALWLQMYWAVRPMETCLVQVKHWCERTSMLTLPKTITKNGQERYMVVDRMTALIINNVIRGKSPQDHIFTTRFGQPWSTQNQAAIFRRMLTALGLKGSLYSCRHYAATTLMEQYKGEWRKVLRITGHQSMKQLEIYQLEKEHRSMKPPPAYEEMYETLMRHAHGPIRDLLQLHDQPEESAPPPTPAQGRAASGSANHTGAQAPPDELWQLRDDHPVDESGRLPDDPEDGACASPA